MRLMLAAGCISVLLCGCKDTNSARNELLPGYERVDAAFGFRPTGVKSSNGQIQAPVIEFLAGDQYALYTLITNCSDLFSRSSGVVFSDDGTFRQQQAEQLDSKLVEQPQVKVVVEKMCAMRASEKQSTTESKMLNAGSVTGDVWRAPKFTEFPVWQIYSGSPAALVLDNDTARDYRSQFNENLERDPTFAGEYIGVQWGCGTQCVIQHFISKRTGRVLEDGFGGECGETVEDMRVESRLVVTKGPVCDDNYNEVDYKVKFYVLEGERLKLISEKSIPRPAD